MVGAQKMTEYCQVSEMLMVYHSGMHKCPPKPNTKKNKILVREAVVKNISVDTHAIQQAMVGQAVETGNISEARRRALHPSYCYKWFEKGTFPG